MVRAVLGEEVHLGGPVHDDDDGRVVGVVYPVRAEVSAVEVHDEDGVDHPEPVLVAVDRVGVLPVARLV